MGKKKKDRSPEERSIFGSIQHPKTCSRLDHNSDADHAVFQRRATKPTMLWTTNVVGTQIPSTVHHQAKEMPKFSGRPGYVQHSIPASFADSAPPFVNTGGDSTIASNATHAIDKAPEHPKSTRIRSGMSLSEYLSKKGQVEQH